MGGEISKEQLVCKDGCPSSYLRLTKEDCNWLCKGSIPCFQENIDFLKNQNVGMIVSLTIEKLKPGLNINHVPYDFNSTEWVFGDLIDIEENFVHEHIPCADNGHFHSSQASKLIECVEQYHKSNPEKLVYLHCWAGRGRASTAMRYILQKLYKYTFYDTNEMVEHNPKEAQKLFLKGKEIPKDMEELYYPEIRTPKDHKCWDLFDPLDNGSFQIIRITSNLFSKYRNEFKEHDLILCLDLDPLIESNKTITVRICHVHSSPKDTPFKHIHTRQGIHEIGVVISENQADSLIKYKNNVKSILEERYPNKIIIVDF